MADPADFSFGDSGVSEDDKREVLAEIERVASEHHIQVSDDVFEFTATKNGAFFPVLVNIIGIALLAGGVVALAWFFRAEEADLKASGQVVVTAESRLIEEIKKETEAQLAAKEDEIAGIQAQLESINNEREELAASIEERLASRETELRQQYQVELDAERARLSGMNLSEAEIEERLASFAQTKQREYDQRLAQFRSESEAERQQLEDELNQLEQQFNQTLADANQERESLVRESEARLSEMQDQFESQLAESEAELNAAESELAQLARDQEQAELIRGQIRGLYATISEAIDASDYRTARDRLRDLRTLLNEQNTLRIEQLRAQRPTELFLISSLESLTSYQERFSNPETMQRLSDASLVQRVADLATQAAQAADEGDANQAALLYRQALAVIPAVAESSAYLGAQTDTQSSQELARLNEAAEIVYRDATALLTDQAYQEAVDRFSTVLSSFSRSRFRQPSIDGIERAVQELLAANETRVADLTETIVLREEEIDELRDNVQALETQERETAASLAATRELYSAAQTNLETTTAERSQLAERATSLQAQLDTASQQLDRAQTTLTARETALSETRQELTDTLADLSSAQSAIVQMQADLATARASGSAATGDQVSIDQETAQELSRLRTLGNSVEAARDAYSEYRGASSGLSASASAAEILTAKVAFEAFLSQEDVTALFPDLASEVGRFETSYLESGRQNAILDLSDLLVDISLADNDAARRSVVSAARAEQESPAFDEFADELLSIFAAE